MSARDRAATVLATWFGCGYSPVAPGTVGSLGAVPVHLILARLDAAAHAAAIAGIALLGVWSAERVAAVRGSEDPQCVVIDEVAGALIALGLAAHGGLGRSVVALALFRLLDILKPWPIRASEKARPKGVGIMLDDLLAGLAAGVITRLAL